MSKLQYVTTFLTSLDGNGLLDELCKDGPFRLEHDTVSHHRVDLREGRVFDISLFARGVNEGCATSMYLFVIVDFLVSSVPTFTLLSLIFPPFSLLTTTSPSVHTPLSRLGHCLRYRRQSL